MKNMNNRIFCFFLLTILLSFSGFSQNLHGYDSVKNTDFSYTKIVYDIDNSDLSKFGLYKKGMDEGIGVQSIYLFNSKIYIVDKYHRNIKILNLNSNSIGVSKAFPFLIEDVFAINDKFYLIGFFEKCYILDSTLNPLDSFNLPLGTKGHKNVVGIFSDSAQISFLDNHFFTINTAGNILRTWDYYDEISTYNKHVQYTHGKPFRIEYKDDSVYIQTSFFYLKLKTIYPYTSNYYTSMNLDFNENMLVLFEINQNEFILHLYKRKK
jgi:hypothetical protein